MCKCEALFILDLRFCIKQSVFEKKTKENNEKEASDGWDIFKLIASECILVVK